MPWENLFVRGVCIGFFWGFTYGFGAALVIGFLAGRWAWRKLVKSIKASLNG